MERAEDLLRQEVRNERQRLLGRRDQVQRDLDEASAKARTLQEELRKLGNPADLDKYVPVSGHERFCPRCFARDGVHHPLREYRNRSTGANAGLDLYECERCRLDIAL